MQMRKVFSSHVDEIGYDSHSQELHIKYQNGKTSVYIGVPPSVAAEVNGSASIGQAIHRLVKGQYAHGYKE